MILFPRNEVLRLGLRPKRILMTGLCSITWHQDLIMRWTAMYRRLISGVKGSRTAVHLHAVYRRRSPLQHPASSSPVQRWNPKPRGVCDNKSTVSGRYDLTRHLQPASARLSLNPHFIFLPDLFQRCQRASLNCCCVTGIYVKLKRRRGEFSSFCARCQSSLLDS